MKKIWKNKILRTVIYAVILFVLVTFITLTKLNILYNVIVPALTIYVFVTEGIRVITRILKL